MHRENGVAVDVGGQERVKFLCEILQSAAVLVILAELKALVASVRHSVNKAGRSCNVDSQLRVLSYNLCNSNTGTAV